MIKGLTRGCVSLVQRYLPDPFLFAAILTLIVFVLGIGVAGNSPLQMVLHWGDGFWNLLKFSMQMALVLVTGHTLASSPPFQKLLGGIAGAMKSPTQAIITATVVSIIASWVNWGFGLVIGALLAKEMAKRVKGVDYPLLIACGYIGFIVWHSGISGSVPLTIATKGHFMEETIGVIPTSETIFATFNLVPLVLILVAMPLLTKAMMPEKDKIIAIDPSLLKENESSIELNKDLMTPAERAENSRIIPYIVGTLGLVYVIWYFGTKGFKLNLNIVNFTFLFLGILFHGTPRRFLDALAVAAKGTAGIILQFPFYAGIMGMMVKSGLAGIMSEFFVSVSNDLTFPFFTFLSAGLVNLFVPSGGGQWAVQAPIMIPASIELGVPVTKTAMAVAWGDAWTNLIQPFWALPALGIAGLGARDIMGYCVVALLFSGVIISLSLMFI